MTRCPNKKKCNICIKPACRIDRTNVMIWGGIGWNYKSPSVFLEKEDYIKWKYNYAYLTLVLEPIVFPYLTPSLSKKGSPFYFMEDGAKAYVKDIRAFGSERMIHISDHVGAYSMI